MKNIPTCNQIIETFRSGNLAALHNIKNQIVQIFESNDLALQQEFLNHYLPKFSIKAVMIQQLKGSPEWAAAALSATAQVYAYKRPYELGAVLGDVCYQLAREALNLGKPGVPARYLYFGGEGARSCGIALKQLNQNEESLAYLNKIIPWFKQYNDIEILPSLYLHRIETNLALQRFKEASTLLNQLDVQQLPPLEQQTYKRLKQNLDNKTKSLTELFSEQLSESKKVFNTLESVVDDVKHLLKLEPEAQDAFNRLQQLFGKLEIQKECLTAKDFALALQESRDILFNLKTGESEAVTARAIIETIHITFAKLLESLKHE